MLSKQAAQKALMMRSSAARTQAVLAQSLSQTSVMAATQSKDYHCVMSQNKSLRRNSQMRWFSTSENNEASSQDKEASASSSDSDEELDIDLGDESLDLQKNVKFEKMSTRNNPNFNMYRFDNHKEAFESIKQFNEEFADNITKKQFMIYTANISRSITQNIAEAQQYRDDLLQFNKNLIARMDSDLNERDWPIISNYANAMYKSRLDHGRKFQTTYLQLIDKLFQVDDQGHLNELVHLLDFDVLVQMSQPIQQAIQIPETMLNRISDLLQEPSARKSTSRIVQLLNNLERKPQNTKSYNRVLQTIIEHFSNSQDLEFIDADLKVRIFRSMGNISKERQISQQFMINLIQDIKENLNQLQESNVIDLLSVAESIYRGLNVTPRVTKELEQLLNDLNTLVVEMATENPDLVNFNFLINFFENNRRLPAQFLSQDQQSRILQMIESKVVSDEHYILRNNTAQKKRFMAFGFFSRRKSDVLAKATIDLFVEPNQYRDYWNTYMALKIAHEMEDQATKEEYIQKIYKCLREAQIFKQNQAAEVFLALDQFQGADQEAIDNLKSQVDVDRIRFKEMSEIIQIYLLNKQKINSEQTQELVKTLADKLFQGQEDGFQNSLETRFQLEIAEKLSIHSHKDCVFKREYVDKIKNLSYLQEDKKAPRHAIMNFLTIAKRVMHEGTTLNYSIIRNQQHRTNKNFQSYILDRIYEMIDFQNPYIPRQIINQTYDFIKISSKQRDPEGPHKIINQNKFEASALRFLDEIKGKDCGSCEGLTNELNFFKRNFKRIPDGYKAKISEVIEDFRFSDRDLPKHIVTLIQVQGLEFLSQKAQSSILKFYSENAEIDQNIENYQKLNLQDALYRFQVLNQISKLVLKDDNGEDVKFDLSKQQMIKLSKIILEKINENLSSDSLRQDLVASSLQTLIACNDFFPSEIRAETRKLINHSMTKISPEQVIAMLIKSSQQKNLNARNIVAKMVLSSFSACHGEHFINLEPKQLNNLMLKYQQAESRDIDSYNNFIASFGENFHKFSEEELIQFTNQLTNIGMSQEDIFEAVIDRIQELYDENQEKPEEEQNNIHHRFNKINHRLFCQCLDLGFEDKEFFESLISDEKIKKVYGEEHTFASLTLQENSTSQQTATLMSILASRLDKQRPQFKDLAEQLYSKIIENTETNPSYFQKRDIFSIARAMGKPDPFELNTIQGERYQSYLSKLLNKMGNNVTQNQGQTIVDTYMPDSNKCAIFLSEKNTLFDNRTPDKRLKLYIRTLEQSTEPPMEVVLVNQNDFRKISSKEEQMEFLKKIGLPMTTDPQADNQENTQ